MSKPLVSIVIPTYNSEKTIAKCLESIRRQTYPNIRVIVVDRFSRDRTVEIARKFGAKVILRDCGRAEAKNIGLKEARGKYVCFIDSDMELSRDVVKDCVSLAESDEKIGGIIIPEVTVGRCFWARVRAYERSLYSGTEVESARLFRRSLALKAGGFDEDILFFEEKTLEIKISRLGFKTKVRIKPEIVHNEREFLLKGWIRKKYEYGRTLTRYAGRYGSYVKGHISPPYRLRMLLLNRRFYSNPLYALSLLILKLLEYLSVLLGSIVG